MANGQRIASPAYNLDAGYQSEAQVKRARIALVREIRRKERAFDTQLEVMERVLLKKLTRKTIITASEFVGIADNYNRLLVPLRELEASIRDALYVVSQ